MDLLYKHARQLADADQWVFVRSGRPRRIVGASRISTQFGGFPRVQDWCCAG